MLLTVAMSVTMIGYTPQTALAEGGKATVKLANAEGLDANTEFSFEMYKVGHFDGPGIVLEDNLNVIRTHMYRPDQLEGALVVGVEGVILVPVILVIDYIGRILIMSMLPDSDPDTFDGLSILIADSSLGLEVRMR